MFEDTLQDDIENINVVDLMDELTQIRFNMTIGIFNSWDSSLLYCLVSIRRTRVFLCVIFLLMYYLYFTFNSIDVGTFMLLLI